jgi:hypothetical protein
MTDEKPDTDVLGTWTNELNNALYPFDILLSGVDAASILPFKLKDVLQRLQDLTDEDIAKMAVAANEAFGTDGIEPAHIRTAVEGTKWNWQDE